MRYRDEKYGSSSSSQGRSSFLTTLLLLLLTIIGAACVFQLKTLNDAMTMAADPETLELRGVAGGDVALPSYDYSIDFILDPNLKETMTIRGRDGWQVVGSRRTQDTTTGQYGYEIIFMRKSR